MKEFAYDQFESGTTGVAATATSMPEAASRKARWPTATGSLRTASAMQRLELKEYESYPCNLRLDGDQLRALTKANIEVTPSPDQEGAYQTQAVILHRRHKHR